MIEAKLKEAFSEDQVIEFYGSFEENMKVYEAEDKETMDFMFELIDFDKFKARMCGQKASFLAEQRNSEELSKMASSEIEIASAADLNIEKERAWLESIMQESVTSKDGGWKKMLAMKEWKNDLKMTIYSKSLADSKLDIFRMDI